MAQTNQPMETLQSHFDFGFICIILRVAEFKGLNIILRVFVESSDNVPP
jgi:hypothetical protein